MKVQATCNTCNRTFLLSQIGPDSDAPGRCPFCGARFARHYTGPLVETVKDTEISAAHFAASLRKLGSMETGFDIDFEELIAELGRLIGDNEGHRAAG